MRVLVKERSPGQIEFGLLYGGIALLMLCAARFPPVLALFPSCAFKGLTGMPCPTCGSTRSLVHLSQGNIVASLAMNPLIAICFLGLLVHMTYSLVTLWPRMTRISIVLSDPEKNRLRVGAIMAISFNWIYLVFTQ